MLPVQGGVQSLRRGVTLMTSQKPQQESHSHGNYIISDTYDGFTGGHWLTPDSPVTSAPGYHQVYQHDVGWKKSSPLEQTSSLLQGGGKVRAHRVYNGPRYILRRGSW